MCVCVRMCVCVCHDARAFADYRPAPQLDATDASKLKLKSPFDRDVLTAPAAMVGR